MENMRIAQLKLRKHAFTMAAELVNVMDEYGYKMNDISGLRLESLAGISGGMPLPSGRWGNAIALALEINNYVAAEFLIENAEELNLDTNSVASELGGKNVWSLKEEYLYSQLTYEGIDDGLMLCKEDYQEMEKQKLANERLEKKLSITEEDKKVLKIK